MRRIRLELIDEFVCNYSQIHASSTYMCVLTSTNIHVCVGVVGCLCKCTRFVFYLFVYM